MSMFSRQPIAADPYSGASGSGGSNCCCGSAGGCYDCSPVPLDYSLIIAGVTNDRCANCTIHNGTWTLRDDLLIREWNFQWFIACADIDDEPQYEVNLACYERIPGQGVWWYLGFGLGTVEYALYRKSTASWSCLGSNTLDFVRKSDACTNWPATLTVVPA